MEISCERLKQLVLDYTSQLESEPCIDVLVDLADGNDYQGGFLGEVVSVLITGNNSNVEVLTILPPAQLAYEAVTREIPIEKVIPEYLNELLNKYFLLLAEDYI